MSKPTMFIGSSQTSLNIAGALAEELEDSAEVTVWDEGIFDLNRGTLEALLNKLDEFDFAALVLAPDDLTESKGTSKQSPRDNVLFECGLFMGTLGRNRTFIVHDESVDIKIPTDLAGVTLATYSGSRIGENPQAAVRKACRLISDAIKRVEISQLIGAWKSRYRLSFGVDYPLVEEEIEIKQSRRGRICFVSKNNPINDNYIAFADLVRDIYLVGDWKSTRASASASGAFLLTLHPTGNIMYGYFTGPDENHRVVYCPWILARKVEYEDVDKLLSRGEEILKDTSQVLPTPDGTRHGAPE